MISRELWHRLRRPIVLAVGHCRTSSVSSSGILAWRHMLVRHSILPCHITGTCIHSSHAPHQCRRSRVWSCTPRCCRPLARTGRICIDFDHAFHGHCLHGIGRINCRFITDCLWYLPWILQPWSNWEANPINFAYCDSLLWYFHGIVRGKLHFWCELNALPLVRLHNMHVPIFFSSYRLPLMPWV